MKSQPKSPLAQLNLPLLDPASLALPSGKDQQLIQALIELAAQGRQRTLRGERRYREP